MFTVSKQPGDRLDYDIDLSVWLEGTNDELFDMNATVSGGGAALEVDAIELVGDPTQTGKVWLSGGEHGYTYTVTCTCETDAGRIKEVEFRVKVKET